MPYVLGAALLLILAGLEVTLYVIGLILLLGMVILVMTVFAGAVVGVLIGLAPLILVVLLVALVLFGMFWFGLEGEVLEAIQSRGGTASVEEVLQDVGVAVSDRSECVFATCRAYGTLDDLVDQKEIIVLDTDQQVLSRDQLLKIISN